MNLSMDQDSAYYVMQANLKRPIFNIIYILLFKFYISDYQSKKI